MHALLLLLLSFLKVLSGIRISEIDRDLLQMNEFQRSWAYSAALAYGEKFPFVEKY